MPPSRQSSHQRREDPRWRGLCLHQGCLVSGCCGGLPTLFTPCGVYDDHQLHHIKSILPPSLDPYQFAYRANRSTDGAISTALHSALTHLDTKDSYVRMLVLDFSSAFNTIILQQLIQKLDCLGLNTSLCNWLLDFLTGRPQAVLVGSNASSTR